MTESISFAREQATVNRPNSDLRARSGAQPVQNVLDVRSSRAFTDHQFRADRAVGESLRDQGPRGLDLQFTGGVVTVPGSATPLPTTRLCPSSLRWSARWPAYSSTSALSAANSIRRAPSRPGQV